MPSKMIKCNNYEISSNEQKSKLAHICAVRNSNFFLSRYPLNSESVVECEAPREVCDWQTKIIGIKTPDMIASRILIKDGLIVTNRRVVEDQQSILIKNFYGDIYKAKVIPHQ
jgi:S1-C subfamily serine protease